MLWTRDKQLATANQLGVVTPRLPSPASTLAIRSLCHLSWINHVMLFTGDRQLAHLLLDKYISDSWWTTSAKCFTPNQPLFTEMDTECYQQMTIVGRCWKHMATCGNKVNEHCIKIRLPSVDLFTNGDSVTESFVKCAQKPWQIYRETTILLSSTTRCTSSQSRATNEE